MASTFMTHDLPTTRLCCKTNKQEHVRSIADSPKLLKGSTAALAVVVTCLHGASQPSLIGLSLQKEATAAGVNMLNNNNSNISTATSP